MSKWYNAQGNNSDVVMSSKIRLARNLADAPFPSRMSNEIRKSVCKKIFAAVKNSPVAGEFDLIELQSENDLKRISMAEQGVISPEFAKQNNFGTVLVSKNEDVSIMLCEEDHIRLSVLQPVKILKKLIKGWINMMIYIDNLKIAFNERLGFLTSNPMNLGTGLKASFILHLPAISAKGMILSLTNMVSKLGFDVKPVYSDESDFYELSNRITLGITEKNAIDNLNSICEQIVKQERTFRQELIEYEDFEDKIFRAMGTLKMARKLTSKEFYSLISLVRLGISMGSFDENYETVSKLLHEVGTATIMSASDEGLTVDDTDKIRAQYVRKAYLEVFNLLVGFDLKRRNYYV